MEEILSGGQQESIQGPLLFNIFLCDLFYMMSDIDFGNYVADIISKKAARKANI